MSVRRDPYTWTPPQQELIFLFPREAEIVSVGLNTQQKWEFWAFLPARTRIIHYTRWEGSSQLYPLKLTSPPLLWIQTLCLHIDCKYEFLETEFFLLELSLEPLPRTFADLQVRPYQIGNVNYQGRICWGFVSHPRSLLQAHLHFWSQPFSGAYLRNHPCPWAEMPMDSKPRCAKSSCFCCKETCTCWNELTAARYQQFLDSYPLTPRSEWDLLSSRQLTSQQHWNLARTSESLTQGILLTKNQKISRWRWRQVFRDQKKGWRLDATGRKFYSADKVEVY